MEFSLWLRKNSPCKNYIRKLSTYMTHYYFTCKFYNRNNQSRKRYISFFLARKKGSNYVHAVKCLLFYQIYFLCCIRNTNRNRNYRILQNNTLVGSVFYTSYTPENLKMMELEDINGLYESLNFYFLILFINLKLLIHLVSIALS